MYYFCPATNKSITSNNSLAIGVDKSLFVASGLATCQVGNEWLVLSKNTGMWCYLNSKEWEMVQLFRGYSIREFASLSNMPISVIERFAVALANRGIILPACNDDSNKFDTATILHKKNKRFILTLLLSNRCNLVCKYCYHAFPMHNERGSISRELANSAFRYAFIQPADELMIDFGEIAVNEMIFRQLLSDAKQMQKQYPKHVIYSIQTNGTTLTEKRVAFLKQNDIFVGLSLDGPEILHDEMRVYPTGAGSYRKAIVGLNRLMNMEIPFIVNATIHRMNICHTGEILNFFNDLNISHFVFKPILRRGNAVDTWATNGLSMVDYYGFLEEMVALAIDHNNFDWLDISFITFLQRVLGDPRGWSSLCHSGYCQSVKTQIVVNKDGFCYPCPRYSSIGNGEYCIGSMESIRVKKNLMTTNILNTTGNNQDFLLSKCKNCEWCFFCRGGCPIVHDSVEQHTDICSYNSKMYELIFKTLIPQMHSRKFKRSHKLGDVQIIQDNFFQS